MVQGSWLKAGWRGGGGEEGRWRMAGGGGGPGCHGCSFNQRIFNTQNLIALEVILEFRRYFGCRFRCFGRIVPAKHSHCSVSCEIATKVILGAKLHCGCHFVFFALDACSAREFSVPKVFQSSIQSDPGAQCLDILFPVLDTCPAVAFSIVQRVIK